MRVPLTALTWLAGFGSGSGCTVLYYQRLKKDETRTTSGKAAVRFQYTYMLCIKLEAALDNARFFLP